MRSRRLLPMLVLVLLAVPASAGAAVHEDAAAKDEGGGVAAKAAASASASALAPGRVIRTRRSWECTGRLRRYGRLPIKVISNMPNPGNGDAIRLTGCRGDGKRRTVDLILDVNGNGRDRGTGFDAVRIGMDARDLVVTGDVECGARHTDPNIHQDIVQALSGRNIVFRNFTSGNPGRGRWTCWGAGGGWYVTHANGGIPRNLICSRCRLATYNQNLRIDRSIHSGAKRSVFGFSRSYGIFIGPEARRPVNKRNRVIEY
jgi:hypothetical protein